MIVSITALALLTAASLAMADVNPAPPPIPDRDFNVHNFGAVGDVVTTYTSVIQAAINAASTADGV